MSASTDRPGKGIVVRKYGGSSLATVPRLLEVARDIRRARDDGYAMVIVVSAMGATTDELAELAHRAHPTPPRRELDMLLSVGERITMSLLSMALDREGCPAISFTGSQCGIITDNSHTDARILEVRGDRVREALARGLTVVVAGFQGVSKGREITTLGRGGSDTTAVALAAALGAVRCEILKDVDGVMTADPTTVPDATRHEFLDWEQMQQVAATGCQVVHLRAVEYAAAHGVPLVVRSSFHDGPGTVIGNPGDPVARPSAAPPAMPSAAKTPSAEHRYRPLSMHTAYPVARLHLDTGDPERFEQCREHILARIDPCAIIAEWLDSGTIFRWEALASVSPDRPLFPDPAWPEITCDPDLTVISFAGGRPDTWLAVQLDLAGYLKSLGCLDARFRADGSALRLILPGHQDQELFQHLHRYLVET